MMNPEPTADTVRRAVSEIVGLAPEEIPGDTNLAVLGVGSLELMSLVNRWRREGHTVDFGRLVAEPTIDAWAAHLDSAEEAAR
jgi:aryl carrier-like protein